MLALSSFILLANIGRIPISCRRDRQGMGGWGRRGWKLRANLALSRNGGVERGRPQRASEARGFAGSFRLKLIASWWNRWRCTEQEKGWSQSWAGAVRRRVARERGRPTLVHSQTRSFVLSSFSLPSPSSPVPSSSFLFSLPTPSYPLSLSAWSPNSGVEAS